MQYAKMQCNTDEYAFKIERLCMKVGRLQGSIETQEQNVAMLRGDVMDIDGTVQQKEKRIHDLRKRNQQLEKFNYILDYKICELQKKVKPCEIKLQQLQEQMEQVRRYGMKHEFGRSMIRAQFENVYCYLFFSHSYRCSYKPTLHAPSAPSHTLGFLQGTHSQTFNPLLVKLQKY